jgi:branched-chain amino acid transport system ATP-binding protein
MLEVDRLDAWYGKAQILYGVSLKVGEGECVALMGRNGAGKSTTMKSIMGLVARRRGRVAWQGQDISALPAYRISRLGLGWVPEDRRIFTDLTVRENLQVGRQAARADAPHWSEDERFELFPNLRTMPDRPGGRMSGGEQQMLTIARTLMGNPRLILLDEPSEGVAPVIVEQMAQMIVTLKQQGLSILLSEQNIHFARLVSDHAVVLEKGQVRYAGSMVALMADDAVQRSYLSV